MCNKVWWICENFKGSMEMIEKDHFIFSAKHSKLVCKPGDYFSQTNDRAPIAGFDGLNMFSESS